MISEKDILKHHIANADGQSSSIDDFAADAMEGYRQVPHAEKALSGIRFKFMIKLFKGYIIAGVIIIILITGGVSFLLVNSEGTNDFSKENTSSLQSQSIVQNVNVTTDGETDEMINNNEERFENENTAFHIPVINEKDTGIQGVLPLEDGDFNRLQHIEWGLIEEIAYVPRASGEYNVDIKDCEDVIIVDYSKDLERKIQRVEPVLEGVEAKYENREEQESDKLAASTNVVLYSEYLENAMYYFRKKEYSEAIRHYKNILKHYPDDLNAIFYKGMSFFFIGRYTLAISDLNKAEKHKYNVFYEEARYYKALSLYRKMHYTEALKLFNSIIEKDEFYKDRAIKEKKEIEAIMEEQQ